MIAQQTFQTTFTWTIRTCDPYATPRPTLGAALASKTFTITVSGAAAQYYTFDLGFTGVAIPSNTPYCVGWEISPVSYHIYWVMTNNVATFDNYNLIGVINGIPNLALTGEVSMGMQVIVNGLTGGANGDPHFKGLMGQKYDIQGEAGHYYNLLTTPFLQANVMMQKYVVGEAIGTTMGEIGIKIDGEISIIAFANQSYFMVNEEMVCL